MRLKGTSGEHFGNMKAGNERMKMRCHGLEVEIESLKRCIDELTADYEQQVAKVNELAAVVARVEEWADHCRNSHLKLYDEAALPSHQTLDAILSEAPKVLAVVHGGLDEGAVSWGQDIGKDGKLTSGVTIWKYGERADDVPVTAIIIERGE